jgi:hypothetical protein
VRTVSAVVALLEHAVLLGETGLEETLGNLLSNRVNVRGLEHLLWEEDMADIFD